MFKLLYSSSFLLLTNTMQLQERRFADAKAMMIEAHVSSLSWSGGVAKLLAYNRVIADVSHDLTQYQFIQKFSWLFCTAVQHGFIMPPIELNAALPPIVQPATISLLQELGKFRILVLLIMSYGTLCLYSYAFTVKPQLQITSKLCPL